MIAIKQVVSTLTEQDTLFLIIGFQLDIENNENVAVLIDENKKTLFVNVHDLIIRNDKNINDMFSETEKHELFCYRCIKHVKPQYKPGVSEYYTDIQNIPIHGVLPHCPICEKELFSKAYYTASEDYKNYKRIEESYFS